MLMVLCGTVKRARFSLVPAAFFVGASPGEPGVRGPRYGSMTLLFEAGSFQRSSQPKGLIFRSLLPLTMGKVRFFFLIHFGPGSGSKVGAGTPVQVLMNPGIWCGR